MAVGVRARALGALGLALAFTASGCAARYPATESARSAVEQLLLTTSANRAVSALDLPDVDGRAVAVELSTLGPGDEFYTDAAYLGSRLELRLASAGARIVDREEADVLLRAYVESLGTHVAERRVGIEGFLPLFESRRKQGITRIQVAFFGGDGKVLRSGGATVGKAFFEVDQILLLIFLRQDILPAERGYRGD